MFKLFGFASVVAYIFYYMKTASKTPLKDSLTPEQLVIRAKAVADRKKIYLIGMAIGVALFIYLKIRGFTIL